MNEVRLPPQNDTELRLALQQQLDAVQAGDPARIMAMLAPQLVCAGYAEREVQFQYPLSPWMLNAMDILHGGILSAMLDNSMGTFTRAFTAKSVVTLNLQLSYSAPVQPSSQWLHTRCRMTALTNRFAHLSATAWAEDGAIAVTSTGVFYIIK